MKRTWTVLLLAAGGILGGCQVTWNSDRSIEYYVAGTLAMERGKYEAALAELAKAVRADPKLSVAYAAVGDIHRKRGNNHQAAGAYERACQTNPYAFRPHYNLGVTYQLLAAAAKPVEVAARYVRKAVLVYLRAVTLKPEDFDANLNLSACYFQEGKYDLAEQYCKAAINVDPKNPYAFSNLGIIYDAQNRPYDAISAYKDSLELDVHQPKLLLNLGATYTRLRRLRDAEQAFKLATREDPNFSPGWQQLGTCYYLQRNWPKALTAYQQAARLDGRNAAAFRGIGVVYISQFLTDRTKAELSEKGMEAWHRSLELDSEQPDLLRLVRKYAPKTVSPKL